jgi:hypothetical protein
MADKNQLKIADQIDLADDDPFAELTRIMGFDPRQPARPAAPAPTPEPAAAEEDDFSLDLEKELLGSFDLEDEQAFAPGDLAVEPTAEAATSAEPVEPRLPTVDFDFSSAFDAALAEPDDVSASDTDMPETDKAFTPSDSGSEAAEIDFDFSSDFDAAMAEPEAFEVPATATPEPAFDGDLDAAFAAALDTDDGALETIEEPVFDLGLAEEDVRVFDEPVRAPELPVTPEAVARDAAIEDDLDAAIANFMADEPAFHPAAGAPPEMFALPVEALAAEEPDFDLSFDEGDLEHVQEIAPAAMPESEIRSETLSDPEPDIDESAFQFSGEDLRLDEEHADEGPRAETPAVEIAFDEDVFVNHDLGDDTAQSEISTTSAHAEDIGIAAEPGETAMRDLSASNTASAAAPRQLPISPMDVAAEEFRQREAAAEPAGPEFNLEDELNALLGNLKAGGQSAETVPSTGHAPHDDAPPYEALSYEQPSYERPHYEPPAYTPPAYESQPSGIFGTTGHSNDREPRHDAFEPAGVDAPEHPADIGDDLKWELDEAFVDETEPAQAENEIQAFAEGDRFDTDVRAPEAGYADDADAWEAQAPIDLDEMFDELAEAPLPDTAPSYGEALAGAAMGAGFGSRPFESDQRFARHRQGNPLGDAGRDSPHRDPVVRGNPLKEDPLDIITQLAEKYSRTEPVTPYGRAMNVAAGYHQAPDDAGGDIDISDAFEEQPEVETIEVSDQPVALADDLDIPELPEEDALPPGSEYDDLDAEFSSLLSEMNAEQAEAQPANGAGDPLAGGFSTRPYEVVATPYGDRSARAKAYDDDNLAQDTIGFDPGGLHGSHALSGARYAADDFEYDPEIDQEIAASQHLTAERRGPRSRGMLVAGLVGGVALVGALGAFALSFGGGDDAPAIVRADEDPVKVRPENPGGATVPNQDSKVYETVAGEGAATDTPQQEKLVTTTEEPMEVMPPALEDEGVATASGKSEDRIEQILEEAGNQTDAEIVAVAPRKVRTMVVKPDGTLVPREDEVEAAGGDQTEAITAATPQAAPAPAIPEPADPEPIVAESTVPESAVPESTGALPATTPAAAEGQAPAAVEEDGSDVAAAMPDTVPVAPLRPADQPIDVVGEVQPDQVAAATATAAASAGWAMQIASQPSEAAAQSSYQNLVRRYGAVLEGREVNIVKAEIAGKGTFWRVRVPADSRNEAIGLCENYKAAGGNCFVSR